LWFLLPEQERTAARALEHLRAEGFNVSKATVARWAKAWKEIAYKAVNLIDLPKSAPPAAAMLADLADVPAELRAVIPDRLLLVAKGKGLDRVENAIAIFCDGIAARAPQILDGSFKSHTSQESQSKSHSSADKSLRLATGSLATMAAAMERVIVARATVS